MTWKQHQKEGWLCWRRFWSPQSWNEDCCIKMKSIIDKSAHFLPNTVMKEHRLRRWWGQMAWACDGAIRWVWDSRWRLPPSSLYTLNKLKPCLKTLYSHNLNDWLFDHFEPGRSWRLYKGFFFSTEDTIIQSCYMIGEVADSERSYGDIDYRP